MGVSQDQGPYGLGDPGELFAHPMDAPFEREYEVQGLEEGEMAANLEDLEVGGPVGIGPDGTVYVRGRVLGRVSDEGAYVRRIAGEQGATIECRLSSVAPPRVRVTIQKQA